jgi:uncharacterized protein (DUF2132 family)
MSLQQSNDPLNGRTLEYIVQFLADKYGWEELGRRINIKIQEHTSGRSD